MISAEKWHVTIQLPTKVWYKFELLIAARVYKQLGLVDEVSGRFVAERADRDPFSSYLPHRRLAKK